MKGILKTLSVCVLVGTLLIINNLYVSANPGTIIKPTNMSIKPPVTISEPLVDVSASPGIIVDPTRR